jgi:RNA polymerase sigma-70 factor (ECF subfamily)
VYGLALAIVRERQGAEEATLDAYTQVWQQAPAYAPARGAALTWILAIARSRALDLARANARAGGERAGHDRAAIELLAAELFTADADPLARTVGAERGRRVREAVADLPRGQREAITAAYFRGLSHAEVSKALGLPLGTVKSRIRAAIVSLATMLSDLEHEP